MLTLILLSLVYGAVWGFLWGGIEAVMILKGFLANPTSVVQQVLRGFAAMILANLAVGLIFGGGGGLLAIIVAVIVAIYTRPWVMARWRW
jgi:hypothetical protein